MPDTAKTEEQYDLAEWTCCDEHMTVYLIDEPCPECEKDN